MNLDPLARMSGMTEFASLSGLRIAITGASSGIGRAIALESARAGANVLVHYAHSADAAASVAQAARDLGVHAELLRCDFSQHDGLSQFIDSAWSLWGGLDAWVHNAGADLLTGEAAKANFTTKLNQLWQVDVAACLHCTREIGRRMVEQGHGSILTIGWDQADRGMEGDSGELFSTAKNAIMGFTRSLAVSLAPAVRVNCIAPGWIQTAWGETAPPVWQERVLRETPLQRWGQPQDIAALARFLMSREASYITGQVINANGGAVR